ncbi:MupG family TIM beta-alpha barrel fold protein [Bacillus marasmi]|uniref:MupG family TIM beta-alpha barrel fold protein n=1 Tax=Bacillus marasmi TaxID=1926279 RepID=UPI0011CA110A|nr:MupG family TIM beta-alpha barrel fold protein [Bacillus marasmi]
MIGISFYLNDPKAEDRIKFAAEKGVKRAFTSLHIPEESGDLAVRAKHLLELAQQFGIEVFSDVSSRTPAHLGLTSLEQLAELGVVGLRLDDFFNHETILRLAEKFKIALNSSIILEEELMALIESGLDPKQLIAWHNFYPRVETGLSEPFFLKQNALFQRFGIPVSAYICGDGEKRGPLFAGLPTLENHRSIDPFASALDLVQMGVKDVYIGDPEVSGELLEKLIMFDSKNTVPLRIDGFQAGDFRLRPDFARDVLRLMDTRCTEPVPPHATLERPFGTITVDNDLYGRYRGEVQIALQDLEADTRVNVVGKVIEADLPILRFIQPGYKIKLIN